MQACTRENICRQELRAVQMHADQQVQVEPVRYANFVRNVRVVRFKPWHR
jgi:hypothetical protein